MSEWYRVIDPMSPLFGCDVKGNSIDGLSGFLRLTALRRLDVVVGDRPFQLVNEYGLGILIDKSHLADSPIQDDVVEFSKDKSTLYGEFMDENMYNGSDHTMTIVRFTKAAQAALLDSDGRCIASNTWYSDDPVELEMLEGSLCNMLGADLDALTAALKSGRIE